MLVRRIFPGKLARTVVGLAALAACCSELIAQAPAFDVLIRGGRVVDGTGNPWYQADVGIRGDRLVWIGRDPEATGVREIDAEGLVVAPGFIDMHSHSDWVLLEDGDAQSKIRQGVTTEVLGEGFSAGPNVGRRPAVPLRAGPAAAQAGADPAASDCAAPAAIVTLEDYFRALERSGISVNIASYVGIGNLWESVMGKSFDRPTDQQLQEMKELLTQAMDQGAVGLSTQLMTPPGSLATTEELVELCREVKRLGGVFNSHIRNEGIGVFDSVREVIDISEQTGVPVDILHLKIADQQLWGHMRGVVELIEKARQRGVNVRANVYPYTRGNNNLASIIPPWAHEGGRERMLQRLRDPAIRERLKREITEGIAGWYNHYTAVGGDWSRILISGAGPYKGMTMAEVIEARSQGLQPPPDPLDILFDLLLESGGSVGAVYAHHAERDMRLALVQPWCSIGSDGSALAVSGSLRRGHPHPRNFGTFPRVLGVYVREQGVLRLEDAIRKMTSLNAEKVGIMDRGLLRPGMFADVTILDPQTVVDQATYSDPFQYCRGIAFVLVNGQIVLDGDHHTGAHPGRVLRRRGHAGD